MTQEEKRYSVQEVSKMYGITKHTIRFYTDKGLIPTLKRDKNNNRLFDKESLKWLEGCICLKSCGMSIKDLKKYQELCLKGNSTIQERYGMIEKCRDLAKENLEKAQKVLAFSEYKLEYYKNIMDGNEINNEKLSGLMKAKMLCKLN